MMIEKIRLSPGEYLQQETKRLKRLKTSSALEDQRALQFDHRKEKHSDDHESLEEDTSNQNKRKNLSAEGSSLGVDIVA